MDVIDALTNEVFSEQVAGSTRPNSSAMGVADDLEALLGGRTGWHFVDSQAEKLWAFGEHGEARIVVTQEGSGFHTYVAEIDEDLDHQTTGDLTAWINLNEPTYLGLSELAKQYADALADPDIDQWEQRSASLRPGPTT